MNKTPIPQHPLGAAGCISGDQWCPFAAIFNEKFYCRMHHQQMEKHWAGEQPLRLQKCLDEASRAIEAKLAREKK